MEHASNQRNGNGVVESSRARCECVSVWLRGQLNADSSTAPPDVNLSLGMSINERVDRQETCQFVSSSEDLAGLFDCNLGRGIVCCVD